MSVKENPDRKKKNVLSKNSVADVCKTASKRSIDKIVEATGDLFGNSVANKFTEILL